MPAFYTRPASVPDIVDHVATRVLDQFGLDAATTTPRWAGLADARRRDPHRAVVSVPDPHDPERSKP